MITLGLVLLILGLLFYHPLFVVGVVLLLVALVVYATSGMEGSTRRRHYW